MRVYRIIMIKFSLNKNSISSHPIIFYKVDLTLIIIKQCHKNTHFIPVSAIATKKREEVLML